MESRLDGIVLEETVRTFEGLENEITEERYTEE
jgi:hypothetical protein